MNGEMQAPPEGALDEESEYELAGEAIQLLEDLGVLMKRIQAAGAEKPPQPMDHDGDEEIEEATVVEILEEENAAMQPKRLKLASLHREMSQKLINFVGQDNWRMAPGAEGAQQAAPAEPNQAELEANQRELRRAWRKAEAEPCCKQLLESIERFKGILRGEFEVRVLRRVVRRAE